MPNHTKNVLKIYGNDIKRVRDLVGEDFDANKIVPMPEELKKIHIGYRNINGEDCTLWIEENGEELPVTDQMKKELIEKYGELSWYDWACKNWGTKWGPYNAEWINDSHVIFNSAWDHSGILISKLHKIFPDLEFNMEFEYEDEGSGFFTWKPKNPKPFMEVS